MEPPQAFGHDRSCSWRRTERLTLSPPTLCSERKNQNRALRKEWGTLSVGRDRVRGESAGHPSAQETHPGAALEMIRSAYRNEHREPRNGS